MNTPQTNQPASATAAGDQREALLESERRANDKQPRNFKEDALDDKVVTVDNGGTGPTSTGTFDPKADQAKGSGNKA